MKRILYFGTMPGRAGHWPYAYSTFSPDEIDKFNQLDILYQFTDRCKFFHFQMGDTSYFGFGVPYSPDDKRAGCKTLVLIENGTKEDIVEVLKSNHDIGKQFKKVFIERQYTIQEVKDAFGCVLIL
ncbi:hypothetical protein [Phocaeicola plebeius]|uniref:hypothetical protein n=1 Tax=Phocaeicola plebeius TaxID=310297 RepID=UPI003AB5F933